MKLFPSCAMLVASFNYRNLKSLSQVVLSSPVMLRVLGHGNGAVTMECFISSISV